MCYTTYTETSGSRQCAVTTSSSADPDGTWLLSLCPKAVLKAWQDASFKRFIFVFTWKAELQKGRRGRDRSCAGSLPKWLQRPELKWSEARSFLPGLPHGYSTQALGPSSTSLPDTLAGSCWDDKQSHWDLNKYSYEMLTSHIEDQLAMPQHKPQHLDN